MLEREVLVEFCQENALVIANTLFQQHKRRLYTWTSPDGQLQNQIDYILCTKDGEALYSQKKQDPSICCLQETHLKTRETYRLKVKGWKKIYHANRDQKKAGVAILISYKIDFEIKAIF